MLTSERKSLLLKRLQKNGRIVAKIVAQELRLSEDSIRRDLRELAAEGLLTRVHGGALPASPPVADLASRRGMAVVEKMALGRAAAQLLRPGQTIFLDGGTTHREMVRSLPLDYVGHVYTHSPTIAAALEHHRNVDIVLYGGKLFRHSMVAVGAETIQAIERLRVDLFFLGVTGLHPQAGLTTGDFEEAAIKRAIVARAAETIVLATQEKIGAVSAHQIAPLSVVARVIVAKSASMRSFGRELKIRRAI